MDLVFSDVKPQFEILIGENTPQTSPLDEPVPVWIKSNKPLLIDFLCYAKGLSNALGLAANQLSHNGKRLNKRFFVFRPNKDLSRDFQFAIDPKIEERYGKPVDETEGCLTWPGKTIVAKRYLKVRVSYYTLDGERVEKTLDRSDSQVWQHEMDHLNGVEEKILPDITTYRREQPKVGRNDPCPCGSGKKFKRCCG